MNPQHDERTTGDLNRQAASAAQRLKEKRNVAVATATGLLAVALAGGSLAFTAIDRSATAPAAQRKDKA
jgi:Na+/glutamate symporter